MSRNVSFVVTVYNKIDYLRPVVQGILLQEGLQECEYIFVDDGSSDGSVALLKELLDGVDNVKIIEQTNTGPAIATNRGIDAATMDYVKLVDGDDVLHPLCTAALFDAMEAHNCGMGYFTMDPGSEVDDDFFEKPPRMQGIEPTVIRNPIRLFPKFSVPNLTGILTSKKLLSETGGCDPRVFLQDYSLIMPLAAKTDFVFIHDRAGWYPEIESDVDNRASQMGAGAQVLHDLNYALAWYVADHPELNDEIKCRMLKQAAGRAWKWARRQQGKTFFSTDFKRYVTAQLAPGAGNVADRIFATCEAFTRSYPIRKPDPSLPELASFDLSRA